MSTGGVNIYLFFIWVSLYWPLSMLFVYKMLDKIWKKREGAGNIRRGLAPLCELYKETLKISHPPIVKPTSPPFLSPIFSKNFLSPPHYSHFWKISFIPPFMKGKGRGGGGFGLRRVNEYMRDHDGSRYL